MQSSTVGTSAAGSAAPGAVTAAIVDGEKGEVKTKILSPEEVRARQDQDKALKESLESRAVPVTGNPNATIADQVYQRVEPRYDWVQNQSGMALIMPDLKTNPDDTGLMMYPGEAIKLTDYYSPMEINRSKGLRYAASKMPGLNGKFALVPLANEEEASVFKVPQKQVRAKGDVYEDQVVNDFDLRFEELEMRDAKREEKLYKKTLAGRVTKQHGQAPARV